MSQYIPQAPMLRLTKCKDSENDGHNAAMRTCTLDAKIVHISKYNFVWWEAVNTQVHMKGSEPE